MVTPYTKVTFTNVVAVAECYASLGATLPSQRKLIFLDKVAKCFTATEEKLAEEDWNRLNVAIGTLIKEMAKDRRHTTDLARVLFWIERNVNRHFSGLPEPVLPVQILEPGERMTILAHGEIPHQVPKVIDLRTLTAKAASAVLSYLQEEEPSITEENLFELLQFSQQNAFASLNRYCRNSFGCTLLKDSLAGLSNDNPDHLYESFQKFSLQETPDALTDLYLCNKFATLTLHTFAECLQKAAGSSELVHLRQKCVDFAKEAVMHPEQTFYSCFLKSYLKADFLQPVFVAYFEARCSESLRYSGQRSLSCSGRTLIINEETLDLIQDQLHYVQNTLMMLPYFDAVSLQLTNVGELWKILDCVSQHDSLKTVTITLGRPRSPGLDLSTELVKNWKEKNVAKAKTLHIQIVYALT